VSFQYPGYLNIEETGPLPRGVIDAIYYYTGNNVDSKRFSLTMYSTSVTDVSKFQNEYKTLWPESKRGIDSPVVISSQVVTVGGKAALKQVVNDGKTSGASSIWTLYYILNGERLYLLNTGINQSFDNTPYAATPGDVVKEQGYLDLFLSTIKFL
jgi:hypothetical protein